MGLSGLIAGALGGAAKGYTENAEAENKKRIQLDLQKELMALEEEKALRVDEVRRNRDFADKKRDIQELDPLRIQSKVGETTAVGGATTDVMVGREDALRPGKAATARAEADARADAERAALGAYAGDPNARAGTRAKAADSETSSQRAAAAASVANANLTNLSIKERQAVTDLQREYENPNTSDARRAEIMRSLTVRGVVKPGEFDTEKVTTERTGDDGSTVKTERTQRRTGASAPAAQYKEGDTVTLKNGGKGVVINVDGKLMVKPL
jgi:hypothetical protein